MNFSYYLKKKETLKSKNILQKYKSILFTYVQGRILYDAYVVCVCVCISDQDPRQSETQISDQIDDKSDTYLASSHRCKLLAVFVELETKLTSCSQFPFGRSTRLRVTARLSQRKETSKLIGKITHVTNSRLSQKSSQRNIIIYIYVPAQMNYDTFVRIRINDDRDKLIILL